jgi:hypothetical protein
MAGRPVGIASFGAGVMVVCEDGTAWYMGSPSGVWIRQMPVPHVPPLPAPAPPPPGPGAHPPPE